MRLLILGGTQFVGRHIAEAALAAGWEVTLFHRGKSSAATLLPTARHVLGDRETDLARLGDARFDAVVDTCGYQPRIVRLAAEFLVHKAKRYVFVSTISVYEDFAGAPDESAPRSTIADPHREDVTGETYGPLKSLCEAAVAEVFGAERTIVLRPGVVAGPYDPTDRFTYWVRRAARGGAWLAPGDGQRTFQVIDGRDLAAFALRAAQEGLSGPFNLTGRPTTFGDLVAIVGAVTGGEGRAVWISEEQMERLEVAGWSDMPLFLSGRDQKVGNARAKSAGLTLRPLVETALATAEWDKARGRPPLKTGIAAARESAVLQTL